MPPHNFFAALILLLSAFVGSAASIIKPTSNSIEKPTSNLINHLDLITTVQALQALRDETLSKNVQENVQTRLAKVSASSSHEHESHRELKPDSTKSAKNDSKCAKNNIENTYFAEMNMCKAELADTKAKLAAVQEEMSKPHWLFVQVADKCVLDLSGDTPTIESADFNEETELFTDRPLRYNNETTTAKWFKVFNELFDDGNGWPNTAMTFVHNDESVGVVVTVFVDGYIKEGNGGVNQTIYGYKLKQSEEQKNVNSLEEIAGGQDKTEFDHCSLFIDPEYYDLDNPYIIVH